MNKRKKFLSLAALAVATILSGSFISCSGDNESLTPPSPIIIHGDVLVTSAGKFRFAYNENGTLTSITGGGETYTLQGDKFSMKTSDGCIQMDVFTGSDGLIRKTTFKESDEYNKGEGSVEYSYSSDRRLKSLSYSVKGSNKYGGTYEETAKGNFTWKDGNLTQVTLDSKETGRESGESYSDSWTLTYTYTYGNVPNVSKQFPYYVGEDITGFEETGFCIAGLFGYGPDYLPTSFTESGVENGSPHSHTYTLTFTQNSNGTLNSEMLNNAGRITYSYSNAPTRADGIDEQAIEHIVHGIRFSLFKHRRK